jgi:hypothetical protein
MCVLADDDGDGSLAGFEWGKVFAFVVLLPLGLYKLAAVSQDSALFKKACKRALGGGVSGAIAMLLQVFLLMWQVALLDACRPCDFLRFAEGFNIFPFLFLYVVCWGRGRGGIMSSNRRALEN